MLIVKNVWINIPFSSLHFYTRNMQRISIVIDYFNSTAVKDWNILHCLIRAQVGDTSTSVACDLIELALKKMTEKRANFETGIKAMRADLNVKHSSRKVHYSDS